MSVYGLSGGLVGAGVGERNTAMGMLGQAADQEQQRNLENQQIQRQTKQGNQQLGATGGALIGMEVGGPMGAVVGGLIGGVAGGLF
jgi:hypothetical protein